MSRHVLKFGGTSVGDLERIAHVADIVADRAKTGVSLAVVVSAMSGETNRLVALAQGAADADPTSRAFADEYDAVVSAGEQVTSGLLAMALRAKGLQARSWQGWQLALQTEGPHASARIAGLSDGSLGEAIDKGQIAIISGFQGVTDTGRIATLGRGGSDTSAVAVAIGLNAAQCDIYTDVDGVYTSDPRKVKKAQRIEKIAYEEMLELASLGAKVLQTRSVQLAHAYNMPLRVLSGFLPVDAENPGTWVCDEEDIMEKNTVTGVTYSRDEVKFTLFGVQDKPGASAEIFSLLAGAHVNVDMIVQAKSRSETQANIVFTCNNSDKNAAEEILSKLQGRLFERYGLTDDIAKVSVVGIGMKTHTGVAAQMFAALSDSGLNIEAISTSEIKISVLIDADATEYALRALHTAFGLDG